MNHGKSFDWFDFALQTFPRAQYIGKSDMDSFVHGRNLLKQLRERLPAQKLFYGFDCDGSRGLVKPLERPPFLCGELYLSSVDLLHCAIPVGKNKRHDKVRAEDQMMTNIIQQSGECEVNHAGDELRFIDIEGFGPWSLPLCLHGEVVLIHQLKSDEQWSKVSTWLSVSNQGQEACPFIPIENALANPASSN